MRSGFVQVLVAAVGTVLGMILLTGLVWTVVGACVVASRYLPLVGRRHAVRGAPTPRDAIVERESSHSPK